MRKKLILSITVLIQNITLAAQESLPIIIKIDTASESESLVIEKILFNHSSVKDINKDSSNNLTVQLNESQEKIEDLILKLRAELGGSVKIEQLTSSQIKKGSQDGEFGK